MSVNVSVPVRRVVEILVRDVCVDITSEVTPLLPELHQDFGIIGGVCAPALSDICNTALER
jgi:hypothetical protein